MTKPYGKFANRYRNAQRATAKLARPQNLRIKINGRYDLEQTSLLLQRVLAQLADSGVTSIENCVMYLAPLGPNGDALMRTNAKGEPLNTLEIALPITAKFGDASGR
jgi:hypothetical protein